MPDDPTNGNARRRAPRLPPAAIAGALGAVAALIVLNVAATLLSSSHPWLAATTLVLNLVAAIAGACVIVWLGLSSEASTARMQAALDTAETRLAGIVDTAMDAIITIDARQRVLLFNRAAEEVFGVRREDAIGGPLDRFLPARYRDAHRGHVEAFGRTGISNRRMGEQTVLWGLRADGGEFPIEASISQVGDGDAHLYTVILRDISRRLAAERAVERHQQELRELSARVLEAREEEKTLIARELHDELGQLLTALKMDVAWLRARLPADDAALAGKGRDMDGLLDRTVASVRRISADLRPLMLDDLGLADAAGWLVEDFRRRSGVECSVEIAADGGFDGVARPAATAVYRALQESLTNIGRHAGAGHAWVRLANGGGRIVLEVEDDGGGIAPDALGKKGSLGLRGMRERARYLGGSFEIARAARGGTRLRMEVPVQAPEGEA